MQRALLSAFAIPLAGLILLPLGCNRPAAPAAGGHSQPPPAVTVVAAVAKDVPVYLDAIGKIVPMESVSIVPQAAGKVLTAHVTDGAFVKKGDVLFEIDKAQYVAEQKSAEAQLAEHTAELSWAQADYKRTEELFKTNVASQLEFEQKKSNLGVINAKILAAQAAIDASKLKVEYCTIVSPLDGRCGARLVDQGNIVKENEGVMVVIHRIDPIYTEFTVTENDLGTVRKFMAARGLPVGREDTLGLVTLVDVPGTSERIAASLGTPTTQPQQGATNFSEARQGKLTFLDNTVQTNSGTVRLRANMPNADFFFWPGQFVNVRLILTTKKDAVLIPLPAQQVGQQGPFVFVIKQGEIEDPATKEKHPASVAEMRMIKPGQRQGDMLVVDSGIAGGEQVVIAGHMMVIPGGPVTVTNAPQAAQMTNAQARMTNE